MSVAPQQQEQNQNTQGQVSEPQRPTAEEIRGSLTFLGGVIAVIVGVWIMFFSGPGIEDASKMNAKLKGQSKAFVKKAIGAPDGAGDSEKYWYYHFRCKSELTEKPATLRVHFDYSEKVRGVICD